MIHIDCLRLVETIDFDIKIVSIQGRMQKLVSAQRDPSMGKIWRPEPDTYVGMCDKLCEYLAVLCEQFGPKYDLW